MRAVEHARATRTLTVILGLAVAVSVVHYADNYFNYAEYPDPASGPDPSQGLVGASWFLFTTAGVAGYVMFRTRGATTAALLLLAFYSGSGLVGFGHYTVPGATDMPVWRQAHIVADIALGIAMLGFVLRAASRRRADTSLV
jgi:hypothetical protein